MNTPDPETTRLLEDIGRTRLGRAAAGAARAVSRAWAGASIRRLLAGAAEVVHRTALPDRVRAIGAWAATAALTDALLTPLDPRPATVVRWILWGQLLVLGAAAALYAERIAAAWTEWRERVAR